LPSGGQFSRAVDRALALLVYHMDGKTPNAGRDPKVACGPSKEECAA
jgi:hypothetical protein